MVAGHDDEATCKRGVSLAEVAVELHARHTGHRYVAQYKAIGAFAGKAIQRLPPARRRIDVIADMPEDLRQALPDTQLVIDDECAPPGAGRLGAVRGSAQNPTLLDHRFRFPNRNGTRGTACPADPGGCHQEDSIPKMGA